MNNYTGNPYRQSRGQLRHAGIPDLVKTDIEIPTWGDTPRSENGS